MSADKDPLATHRAAIDMLDIQIVGLLGARFAHVRAVAALKAAHGLPTIAPARVKDVVAQVRALAAQHALDPAFVERLYRSMIDHAHQIEDPIIHAARVGGVTPSSG